METVKNWTVTIAYGTDKARHYGKYTAMNTDKTSALQQADAYFAKRNRTHRQITRIQEWNAI